MKAILWKGKNSLEYFGLTAGNNGFVLEGNIVMSLEGTPARIAYRVECDRHWKTKNMFVSQERSGKASCLTLRVDSNQIWKTEGSAIPFATGMYDVDLEVTPATNTLPIRRLGLKVGESQNMDAVWVRFPSLKPERLKQRYTRIDRRRYKYECLSTGFTAELRVDESGLVVSYGSLWRRG